MVEISLKKRHTEVQHIYEGKYYKENRDRVLIGALAVIADRLTDIADELDELKGKDDE